MERGLAGNLGGLLAFYNIGSDWSEQKFTVLYRTAAVSQDFIIVLRVPRIPFTILIALKHNHFIAFVMRATTMTANKASRPGAEYNSIDCDDFDIN